MKYTGPEWLLKTTKAVVLNSRQSKYPLGTDSWVVSTRKALNYADQRNMTVLTSLGMNTWEISTMLASQRRLPIILIVPVDKANNEALNQRILKRFRLQEERTGFVFIDKSPDKTNRQMMLVRDKEIIGRADCLLPVSIRGGGNLKALIDTKTKAITRDFMVPYEDNIRQRPEYDRGQLEKLRINPALWEKNLIVHFTRSSSSPWPGEIDFDFYSSLINSRNEFCHSARKTLLQIIRSGVIWASRKNIRGGHKVVGFSRLNRDNIQRLFRYRSRLVNPYFEPYGIGLSQKYALGLGLRPVVYGTPEIYLRLNDDEKPFFQNVGSDGGQWKIENEWRYRENLQLDESARERISVLVPTVKEAAILSERISSDIIPVFV